MPKSEMNIIPITKELLEFSQSSKAWPFEEAKKILKRYEKKMPEEVLFETGYGPSGLPHIGTFGEVARTTMVRHAFHILTENTVKTKLLCFSDDLDGLRKVPDNVPKKDLLANYIDHPLSRVPDPFDEGYPSFGAGNNARLCNFLDQFGFNYEFASASDYYHSGRFDETLLKMLVHYDEIMEVMLPTLGEERRSTYSPFLPISQITGKVLQVPIIDRDLEKGTITYIEPETQEKIETEITKGRVKCQWKADWAMRWVALGVDYEMSGKDLIPSVALAGKICKILGYQPPEGFNYELFLDAAGQKISKSKGNGLTIEEWLRYAPTESLSLYMYQKPKTAKRLYFDIIPKLVDEYHSYLNAYNSSDLKTKLQNPVWHIFQADPPCEDMPIHFTMLLNLVSASNAETEDALWGFLSRYREDIHPENYPKLVQYVRYALRYYQDFVKPHKNFKIATLEEQDVLKQLDEKLLSLKENLQNKDGTFMQNQFLAFARQFDCYLDKNKKNKEGQFAVSASFFQMLYQLLLGQESGPRFGPFTTLYGIDETRALIKDALNRAQKS